MHYEVEINGRLRKVTVHRINGRFVVDVDGRETTVDALRVDAHTWSVLIDTRSEEVTVARPGSDQLTVGVGGQATGQRSNTLLQLGSGNNVFVISASTMRAPRSNSVRRFEISSGTESSYVNGTL